QIVLVRDGVAYGGAPDNSWQLHKAIYDNKQYVNGIFSGCPSSIMAYGISNTPIDSRTLPESYIMMRDIERLSTLSDINDIDGVVATFSPATHVAIIENSCVIATGETITKAFDRFEVSEITARNYLLANVLGTPTPISKDEIEKIDKYFALPPKEIK
ncbi:MAG: class II aldolase/adducin family protein, partial [Clostridia bacterium]